MYVGMYVFILYYYILMVIILFFNIDFSDEKTIQDDRNSISTQQSSSSFGIFNDPLSIQESQVSKNDK